MYEDTTLLIDQITYSAMPKLHSVEVVVSVKRVCHWLTALVAADRTMQMDSQSTLDRFSDSLSTRKRNEIDFVMYCKLPIIRDGLMFAISARRAYREY